VRKEHNLNMHTWRDALKSKASLSLSHTFAAAPLLLQKTKQTNSSPALDPRASKSKGIRTRLPRPQGFRI